MKRVLMEISEGSLVRNLLENNLADMLRERGAEVLVVTAGARVPWFVDRYGGAGISFRDVATNRSLTRSEKAEIKVGKWLCARGRHGLRRTLWKLWAEPIVAGRAEPERALLDEWRPDVVVSTHLSQTYGRGLVAAARRRGIPTVGNMMSWDNVWKGLKVRPDTVACWSENNREEICRLEGYRPEQVKVIGSPAFDAYFGKDALWTREELCARLGLDAGRPVLLFATLGQFSQNIDETSPLELLLRAVDAGRIPGRPQVVLRMHPWSRDAYFSRFLSRPDITVSRYENYVPGLTWSPTRDEVVLAGNLMRHADVVISPGSTMCIEPAIFDTPTLVPVVNEYMPEVFDAYFRDTWLKQHFSRLHRNDWIPIVRDAQAMIDGVNRYLADRSWYREGRAQIRDVFLGPLDGQSTRRFADVVMASAGGAETR